MHSEVTHDVSPGEVLYTMQESAAVITGPHLGSIRFFGAELSVAEKIPETDAVPCEILRSILRGHSTLGEIGFFYGDDFDAKLIEYPLPVFGNLPYRAIEKFGDCWPRKTGSPCQFSLRNILLKHDLLDYRADIGVHPCQVITTLLN